MLYREPQRPGDAKFEEETSPVGYQSSAHSFPIMSGGLQEKAGMNGADFHKPQRRDHWVEVMGGKGFQEWKLGTLEPDKAQTKINPALS